MKSKIYFYNFQKNKRIEKLHLKDKEALEKKFKDEKNQIEKDTLNLKEEVNLLQNETHINEYEHVLNIISNLENILYPLDERILINFKDEELLFSFRLTNSDDIDLIKNKISIFKNFWVKAKEFYELKKQIILNFSEDIDFASSLSIIDSIDKEINLNKSNFKQVEETVIKMSKIIEEDMIIFSDFLSIISNVLSANELTDSLKGILIDALESKKLEGSCKQIISYCVNLKNMNLV